MQMMSFNKQRMEERDQLREIRLEDLRREVQKGIDSGESAPLDTEEIKARGRERLAAISSGDRATGLRGKHGQIETWWHDQFGFGFDELTESKPRYLCKTQDADTIRNRIVEKRQTGSHPESEGSSSDVISEAQGSSGSSAES